MRNIKNKVSLLNRFANRYFIFGLLIGIVIVGYFALTGSGTSYTDSDELSVSVGSGQVTAEVAASPEKQMRGLSARDSLAPEHGMLFALGETAIPSFWMKDMRFPIDIIWIRDQKVVDITPDIPTPLTGASDDMLPTYQPKESVDTVLEVTANWARDHQVTIGKKVVTDE